MHLKKNKTYTLDFFNGISFPQGNLNDFLKNGFNSGVLLHKNISKRISVGLSANHSRFNHRRDFGSFSTWQQHELSSTSFDIGPEYKFKLGKFALEFYGRSGLSIVNSPQTTAFYPETEISITSLEAYKSTSLTTRFGANMTAHVYRELNFYFSSEYITSLNSDLNFQTRDVSKAIRGDGSLDLDVANRVPYRTENLSLSMLNVNIGLRISLGRRKHIRRHQNLYLNDDVSASLFNFKGLSKNKIPFNLQINSQNGRIRKLNFIDEFDYKVELNTP